MKKFFFLLILTLAMNGSGLQAQDKQQKAEEYLNRLLALKRFSGMVLVADDTGILLNKGFGRANYEHDLPFTSNTRFCIAGLSEQMTAWLTLRLVNDNQLSLHAPITELFEENFFPTSSKLSLHHLLSHTSGLPDYPDVRELPEKQLSSKEEMITYLKKVVTEQEPGKEFRYSKLNYNLLGLVLENISGKTFEQLLEDYIKTPLGMKNTCLANPHKKIPNQALGFLPKDFPEGWLEAPYLHPSSSFSALGIHSTTEDMLLWIHFMENEIRNNTGFRNMLKSQAPQLSYGIIAKFNKAGDVETFTGTDHYSSGFNANFVADMKNNLRVIVLSNTRNPMTGIIAEDVRAIFLKKNYILPLPREIVSPAPGVLEKYAGVYSLKDQLTLKVSTSHGKLFIEDGRHPKFEVFPQSDHQFFLKGADAEIKFVRNEKGKVIGVVLRNDGFDNLQIPKTE